MLQRTPKRRKLADAQAQIRVEGDVAYLPLQDGTWAVVDAEDLHLVEGRVWCITRDGHILAGKPSVYMHRIIAGAAPGQQVDHIDRDTRNNRRSNLRICTPSQNMGNMKRPRTNTSGYKGVSWSKLARKWSADIKRNRRHYFLGHFDTPEEAHAAYCEAAERLFGEFARFE